MDDKDIKAFQNFLKRLFNARRFIFTAFVIGLAFSLALSFILPKEYKAEMILHPADRSAGAEITNALAEGENAAVQYFAQRIAASATSNFVTFQHTMLTTEAAEILIADKSITAAIFGKKTPDSAQMREYLKKTIRLSSVGTTPMKRASYYHPDQVFAKKFLQKLYEATDNIMRNKNRVITEKRLNYLKNQLSQTRHPDHRDALTSLLKEQEHLMMLTAIDIPYAAAILEKPVTGPKPSRPNALLLSTVISLAFAFAGYIFYLLTINPNIRKIILYEPANISAHPNKEQRK